MFSGVSLCVFQEMPDRSNELHALIRQAGAIASCAQSRDETALAMVQQIYKRMYDQAGGRLQTQVNVHLILAVHKVSKKVSRFVSDLLLFSEDERKLQGEVVGALLHAGLLSMSELSTHLAKHIDGGRNVAATNFSVRLVRTALLEEQIATTAECTELLQALSKLLHSPAPPDGLVQLLEDASRLLSLGPTTPASGGRVTSGGASVSASLTVADVRVSLATAEAASVQDDNDPMLVREQVLTLWEEWLGIYEQLNLREKAHANFLSAIEGAGWLRFESTEDRFLKIIIDAALNVPGAYDACKPFATCVPLDALSTLIILLVKHLQCDPTACAGLHKPQAQIAFLSKALSLLVQHLVRTYEIRPQVP